MEVRLRRATEEIRRQLAYSDQEERHYVVALKYKDAKLILAFLDAAFPDWNRG